MSDNVDGTKLFRSFEAHMMAPLTPVGHYGSLFEFRPDMALTSFQLSTGVHKIVKSNLKPSPPEISVCFTLISHGLLTHRYSLVPDTVGDTPAIRPIALYASPNGHLKYASIIDLSFPSNERTPLEYQISLYTDSYSKGHIEFCVCEDYRYEWRYEEFPLKSDNYIYVLWRHRLADQQVLPAARIEPAWFRSPIDNEKLWSVEIDNDKVAPHLAWLSAFTVKRLLPLPVISPKQPGPPKRLLNVAFDDDHIVFQRVSKYFSEWEEQEGVGYDLDKVWLVKVYLSCHLRKYALPAEVLDYLQHQMRLYVRALKGTYGYL